MEKVILVTGGNRGIGLETCRQLAEKGHRVIMGSRDKEKGFAQISKSNIDVDVQQLDVREEEQINALSDYIVQQYGHLDVLINNAAIYKNSSGALLADIRKVKKTMKTNFYGPWRLIQILLPLLKQSKEGRIINISSSMGALTNMTGGYAGYRMSKSSLNSLTILLANELAHTSIKVNSVDPGWVRTEMGGANAERSEEEGADSVVWLAVEPEIPNGKFILDRKVIPW
ncbi:MAG: SDR family oxidoreductase [Bacteroidota bacterium]